MIPFYVVLDMVSEMSLVSDYSCFEQGICVENGGLLKAMIFRDLLSIFFAVGFIVS